MPDVSLIHSILIVLVAVAVTIFTRAFPFIVFGRKGQMPQTVKRVADALPPAIIAVLVIYCLKDSLVNVWEMIQGLSTQANGAAASLCGVVTVIVAHLIKRNTLLSIAFGTAAYMIALRVFV